MIVRFKTTLYFPSDDDAPKIDYESLGINPPNDDYLDKRTVVDIDTSDISRITPTFDESETTLWLKSDRTIIVHHHIDEVANFLGVVDFTKAIKNGTHLQSEISGPTNLSFIWKEKAQKDISNLERAVRRDSFYSPEKDY